MKHYAVFITAPDEDTAAALARVLVEEGLAKCVNIAGGVRSIYHWEGKIEDDREVLMIVKMKKENFTVLEKRVKELHPYTVPEIIALPVVHGSEAYLAWLDS